MTASLRTTDPYANMIPGSEAACYLLRREVSNVELIATFTVPGEPVSKARARFTKGGSAYTPASTRAAEDSVAWRFRAATKGYQVDSTSAFGVVGLFFNGTRQRRDVDNMLKLILDGLNGVAWADDTQVTEVSGRKTLVLERDDARTEVAIYRLGEVERRESKCEFCGKAYPAYRSQKGRRFCSQECDWARRRAARTKTCESCGATFEGRQAARYCSIACRSDANSNAYTCTQCGAEFRRARSLGPRGKALCSNECSTAYWREHRLRAAKGTCAQCGGPTSKKTYARCRACVVGHPAAGGEPVTHKQFPGGGLVVLTIQEVAR